MNKKMKIYDSLYNRLQTQHLAIEPIIAGISNERLLQNPAPGKWSIQNNLAHLMRYQQVFNERITRMLAEDQPLFERYSADADPQFEPYLSLPVKTLLEIYNPDRAMLFERLTNLNETELVRVGIHPKYGRLTILQWVEFFALHEAHHLFTIFQLANNTL